MQKDGSDSVKIANRPIPCGKVGLFDGHREPSCLRRFAGALDAHGRYINGAHAKTLRGEPDAVAAVAIAGTRILQPGIRRRDCARK